MTESDIATVEALVEAAGLQCAERAGAMVIFCRSGHEFTATSVELATAYLAGVNHGSKLRLWLEQQGTTETGLRIVCKIEVLTNEDLTQQGVCVFDHLERIGDKAELDLDDIGANAYSDGEYFMIDITSQQLREAIPTGITTGKKYRKWVQQNDPETL